MNIIDKVLIRLTLQVFKNSFNWLKLKKLFNDKETLIIENLIKTIEIDNKITL